MLLLLANSGGGGGGSPGALTFGSYVYNDAVNAITTTFSGLGIGAAASDRWVVAAISVHHDGARSLSTVTIGGVSATKLVSVPTLAFAGTTFEFWKANVTTGTTANVVVTDPSGIIYEGGCATYYCTGEPLLHASAHDNTYTGNTFSVSIDVPEGGAVVAAAFNDGAGSLSAWVGASADATDNTNWTYFASEDLLTVETGRTVSFTTTAQSSSSGFFGLGVVSLEIPAGSGGDITATVGATESADTAAISAAAAHTASLTTTEGQDAASFAASARHSAALAVTEGGDSAAFALESRHVVALNATEGPDTAAFAADARHTADLAATEDQDTASFTTGDAAINASLAATESADTAAFAGAAAHTASLGATEGQDAASFAASARHTAALGSTEGQDTTSWAMTARHTAGMAANEGADVAAFVMAAAHTAVLATTEGGDTAAFIIGDPPPATLTLGVAEDGDTAAFAITVSGLTARRGDDAFGSSGQRERFWREKLEEELEDLLDRAERAATAPQKARKRVAEAFALVEWEKLPEAPRTRDLLATLKAETADYTQIAALVVQIRAEIEAERTKRRRKRDLEALMVLM